MSKSSVLAMAVSVANIFLWVRITPLGTPVEPDVYMIMAGSSLNENMCSFSYFVHILLYLLGRRILDRGKVDILNQFTSVMYHVVEGNDLNIFRESSGIGGLDLVLDIHNGSHCRCMSQNVFEFRQKLVRCKNVSGLKRKDYFSTHATSYECYSLPESD